MESVALEVGLELELEPNPPLWPDSVVVFSPSMGKGAIEQKIQQATGELMKQTGHYSDHRVALLFTPGEYDCDVQVGYYVQVLGLGASVGGVRFQGGRGVFCCAADPGGAGSLDTFWRSGENFTSAPSHRTGLEGPFPGLAAAGAGSGVVVGTGGVFGVGVEAGGRMGGRLLRSSISGISSIGSMGSSGISSIGSMGSSGISSIGSIGSS
ncbi:hypothetical protein B484DRAFT_404197, partial [Ochromonadaceae sp. CCMP2298]